MSINKIGDPEIQRKYNEDLELSKAELLQQKTVPELHKLTQRIGGPRNLANHYGLNLTEIEQIFPKIRRKEAAKLKRVKSPSSAIPTSPGRIRPPLRSNFRPRLYTIGEKDTREKSIRQKMIFYPLPEDIRATRAVRSRSQRVAKKKVREDLGGLGKEMDRVGSEDSFSKISRENSVGRISGLKKLDRGMIEEERKRKAEEWKRRQRRRVNDVTRFWTKDDSQPY